MRYVSLIFFACFLVFCVDFATQNTNQIILIYKLEWLNFIFKTERPVFVPIFFSFAFGIVFSVIYFFIYHALLLRRLRITKKENKKLERLIEDERDKNVSLEKHKNELKVKLTLGVGGLFDFYSKKTKRAPIWLRELGLEWVYRLYQEPKRMWRRYLLGNPAFLFKVITRKLFKKNDA